MDIELVHIGFGNYIMVRRVVGMLPPNSAPTKRMIHDSRIAGKVVDMTSGRRTKAVLVMDSGHVILAAIAPETIAGRIAADRGVQV